MMDWSDLHLEDIDSPALLIDLDRVRANILLAISYAGGTDRLRPHVKTHKMLEIARMQVAAGIYQYKCATIPEAEMLGMAGAKEVLLAYAILGPKVDRYIRLMAAYPDTRYSVLVDDIHSATAIDRKAMEAGTSIEVFVDINDGHHRTGISPKKAAKLLQDLAHLPHIKLRGLHCYDGHIRMSDLEERITSCQTALEPVLALRGLEEKRTGEKVELVVGGSPSFSVHRLSDDIVCSPGTWIFWDARYGTDYPEQGFHKAAVLLTRTISQLSAHRYCLDLGHKSVASEMPFPRVAFLSEYAFDQVGHSEEHLVVECSEPNVLKAGDHLLAYPYHICPTVALYDHVHVFSEGKYLDTWRVTARDRKITI